MTDEDGHESDVNERDEDFDEVGFEEGFNRGFIIGEHEPELAQSLVTGIQHDSSHESGIVSGIQEFFRIRDRQLSRESELNEIREKGRDERDIER